MAATAPRVPTLAAPPCAPGLLPEAAHLRWHAELHRGVEVSEVHPELQGARASDPDEAASKDVGFDAAALAARVARTVGAHFMEEVRRLLAHDPSRVPDNQLHQLPRRREGERAHAAHYQRRQKARRLVDG